MRFTGIILFYLIVSLTGKVLAQEISLTTNGKTDYHIIIPLKHTEEEKKAALLLKLYLNRITKATFPVYTDDQSEQDEEILVGVTNRTSGKYPEIYAPMIRPQGFWIKTSGKKILILGGDPAGTLYGAVTFLEKYLGCRKYSHEVEKIPKNTTLKISLIDDIQTPASEIRIVNGNYFKHSDFKTWCKLHIIDDKWGNEAADRYYVHTFERLVPASVYYHSHPEYFSLINGHRVPWGQLCLTNKDIVKITVEKLREVMKRHPDIQYWSVSQNDNYYSCDCPDCKAIDEAEGSPGGTMLRFVNRVADSFPDKIITTLAYQYTRKPPRITKPRDNVMVTLCTIELNRSRPIEKDPGSADFVEDIKGWSEICDNIMLWDYEVQFTNYLCPFPLFHTLQPNIQFFNKYNVTAHFQQCNIEHGVEFAELKGYLLGKLLWDPEINADSVIDDFMTGYFEEAGPYIHQYFDLIHNELILSGDRLDIYGSPVWHAASFLSAENLKRYNQLFDKAELAVAMKPQVLARVKVARLPVMFSVLEIAKTDLFGERGWYALKNNKFTLKKNMKELLEDFYQICNSEGIKYLNENGLSVETYYQNTLRFINVQTEGNLAFQKKVSCDPAPAPKYTHLGPLMLTNGVKGTEDYKVHWLGWEGLDPRITVDLGKMDTLREITISTLQESKSWILHPLFISCYTSSDGINFNKAGILTSGGDQQKEPPILEFTFKVEHITARYIRFFITATKTLPAWHPYKGNKSWVFIDEITAK
ncbi:MAG: DUF4838 domain-containing protein [Bacteroidales bacterium]